MIAAAAGERSLPSVSAEESKALRARRLVLEAMQGNLAEGKRLYRKGKIGAAATALQRVLKEYAWCPTPLSDEEIATYVQPAEQRFAGAEFPARCDRAHGPVSRR